MNVKYRVDLDQGEREQLRVLSSGGKIAARRLKRVQILLAADAGVDDSMAASLGLSESTIYRTKRRFVEEGLDAALGEQPRPGGARKLSGRDEALLVAAACSPPPEGANGGR
jgi:Winged helix-turn helix